VGFRDGGWGAVSKAELERQVSYDKGDALVGDVVSGRLPHLHPDQPLYIALRKIGEYPFLPVVHRANFQRLEGVLSLQDILGAYRAAFKASGRASDADMTSPAESPAKSDQIASEPPRGL
jgi:hypothetical protein